MITKNFILTDKGRNAGYTIYGILREVDRIVCATEYDIYGQSSLYANSYFKGNCLVGVSISADDERQIDAFVKYMVKQEYLKED